MSVFANTLARLARPLVLGLTYAILLTLSLWASVLLRFDFEVPEFYAAQLGANLLWFIPLKIILLALFGQFQSLLTFFSLSDAKRLVFAMGIAALIALGLWYGIGGIHVLPRACLIADFILSVAALGALRTGMRFYRERFVDTKLKRVAKRKKVGIVGAGSAGSALFREIQSKPGLGMDVVCFFDDDRSKIGGSLHGRKIASRQHELQSSIERLGISRVILAMPSARPVVIKETVDILNAVGIEHDLLPSVTQMLHKAVSVSLLRHVEPGDLLGRDAVQLDEGGIRSMITGQTILVTGAGGSIGSELCRQIASHSPGCLVLIERSEPALFQIEQEIQSLHPGLRVESRVTSVTNRDRLSAVFRELKPSIVFHAAAHKHVPLMESQPVEAILNNAFGTHVTAELSVEHHVRKFVLVSTDKAVNPTSVMGATKRVAELILTELQAGTNTQFAAVRFGNVLGSSGSVIPVFRKQIAAGGPVRVTHPEITRYFMTIPEAVGLVLQCAFQARGGEVFVLDMGEPVKILDLARQMIELSGLKPDADVRIEFTGLRPGEKLYEEPIHVSEAVTRTAHPKILTLRSGGNNGPARVIASLNQVMQGGPALSAEEAKEWLSSVVAEYQSWRASS